MVIYVLPEATCAHKKPSAFVCVSLWLLRNCENEKESLLSERGTD
jgi:hypothetical protein